MSEREKGQTTESWGWAGVVVLQIGLISGAVVAGAVPGQPALAPGVPPPQTSHTGRRQATASRRISLILAGDHVPAWHRTTPRPPQAWHPGTPITAGLLRCAKSSTHPMCAVVGSHPQSWQPNATDCLVCCTPSWPTRRPLTWSASRAGQHSQPCCLGITFGW